MLLLAIPARGEDKWKEIENKSFSFSVPPSFKKTGARGRDSFVEEYVAAGIKVIFDYGINSNDFRDWPKDTRFEDLKIDGKAARLGTAKRELHAGLPYSTQVRFKLEKGMALSMSAACKSEKEVDLARKIFETIAFKAK
ncbi:hypothetical protein [Luteolibacter marinus]|uniref:hypothetical protein n=1 Tax=Luteolibacter marinus TaxID=2776705 RepID=UPI0018661091|nr:hypothetical protein [Luteolibacter marinus]